jgi:hypothetical protein
MHPTLFSRRLAPVIKAWLTSSRDLASLAPVADMLGCAHLVKQRDGYRCKKPPQPNTLCETVVSTALVDLLVLNKNDSDSHSLRIEHTLLDGLLRKERWRSCLETLPAAHAFAALIANFYASYPKRPLSIANQSLRVEVHRKLTPALAGWLYAGAGDVQYTRRTFACALFGEAWCTLTLDVLADSASLADIIRSTKPQFLPGLVPAQKDDVLLDLPWLSGP